MLKILTTCALLLTGICSFAQQKEETGVRAILAEQSRQWNNGNIEGFMQTYWKNDSLMFIGKGGITYGWQKTLENYRRNYPDTAAMGKLQFDLIQLNQISGNCFFVVGKWHLTRSIGNVGGAFTLLIKKIKDRWVIVADHSS